MVEERGWGSILFDVWNYLFVIILSCFCLLPLVHIVAISFSARPAAEAYVVSLWPIGFNVMSYDLLLRTHQFLRSLQISILRTFSGTVLGLAVTCLAAYPLSLARPFPGQGFFKWLLIFSALFSGGLIPQYLVNKELHLINTMWVLILPGTVNMFYIIVLLNFFRQLPPELAEAATIDGASHWQILLRVYLPISLPALATLTLFSAVAHWNAWFDGIVYMQFKNYPLQSYLYTYVETAGQVGEILRDRYELYVGKRNLRAAMIVLTSLPILALYPFLQRYFVKGLTLGSVKG